MRRPVSSGWKDDPSSRMEAIRPAMFTDPEVAAVVPARILKSVLLPDPFSPMTPRTAPLEMDADTPLRACTSACRVRPVRASTSRSRGAS